ncbi:PepSY-associated TM helix domain-containing protein [Sulfurospirillum arsenophilum]|uniref:PepSY-associated TM helix domain-containing protein n=1 Tax=Sulfurospirillum arsenophilum TaxID=56698 RepID=UPI0005A7C8C1|nr:PepSY-associated TM helix domain-containing protein [Sulfurospirillum arsenophilum]
MLERSLIYKYLYRSHTIIGLLVLFLFYMSTYFGTLTFFMPYLKVWESPSRHFVPHENHAFNIDSLLDEVLEKYHFIGDKPVEMMFPSFRDPLLKISSEAQNSLYINPLSNEVLKVAKEENLISTFFNELHTGIVIPLIGMPLMGAMSIGILFLTFGGFWLYCQKRKHMALPKAGWRQTWLSWHKITGLGVIPYALVFALTGSFLGLMLSSSQPFAWSMTHGNISNMRQLVAPILFAQPKYQSVQTKKQMLPFSTLQTLAQEHYPQLSITNATLYHYGKEGAKVRFRGFDKENVAQSGRTNRPSITLDASSGAVVEHKTLEQTHGISRTLSVFYFLHFVPDETLGLRVVLALFGAVLAISLASGYLLWAEKKLHQQGFLGDLTNRVSIAILIGIIPSSALVPFLHWVVAYELFDKEIWIRGAFYAFWSFWLFYTVYERSIVKIIRLMLGSAAWFLLLSVLFHGLKSGFFIWQSFHQKAWTLFYMDIAFILSSIVLFYMAKWVEKKELFYRYERKGVFNGY